MQRAVVGGYGDSAAISGGELVTRRRADACGDPASTGFGVDSADEVCQTVRPRSCRTECVNNHAIDIKVASNSGGQEAGDSGAPGAGHRIFCGKSTDAGL